MDDTHHRGVSPTGASDDDLDALGAADPADAPDIAERIAAELTEELGEPEGVGNAEPGADR